MPARRSTALKWTRPPGGGRGNWQAESVATPGVTYYVTSQLGNYTVKAFTHETRRWSEDSRVFATPKAAKARVRALESAARSVRRAAPRRPKTLAWAAALDEAVTERSKNPAGYTPGGRKPARTKGGRFAKGCKTDRTKNPGDRYEREHKKWAQEFVIELYRDRGIPMTWQSAIEWRDYLEGEGVDVDPSGLGAAMDFMGWLSGGSPQRISRAARRHKLDTGRKTTRAKKKTSDYKVVAARGLHEVFFKGESLGKFDSRRKAQVAGLRHFVKNRPDPKGFGKVRNPGRGRLNQYSVSFYSHGKLISLTEHMSKKAALSAMRKGASKNRWALVSQEPPPYRRGHEVKLPEQYVESDGNDDHAPAWFDGLFGYIDGTDLPVNSPYWPTHPSGR